MLYAGFEIGFGDEEIDVVGVGGGCGVKGAKEGGLDSEDRVTESGGALLIEGVAAGDVGGFFGASRGDGVRVAVRLAL